MVFAGVHEGRIFGSVPPHVDRKLAPGASVMPTVTPRGWLAAAPTALWDTPNTVWFAIAVAMYVGAPYDLSPAGAAAASPLSWRFFALRAPLWSAVVFGYYGFWHLTLHVLGWAGRPLVRGRVYSADKVAHNVFWMCGGVALWVAFENVFAFLWATGRLPYLSDSAALATPAGLARLVLGVALVPIWREFHFYFAHRLLHMRSLYAQVHSLHHRNTDIEPFAGLCMHPVEHLYYYTSVLPSLFFLLSPLSLLFNAVHMILSPAAGHSGYEDHWQADTFHYLHHRYFNVNFAGGNAVWLDSLFGTFSDRLSAGDREGAKPRADAKATLRGAPTVAFVAFLALSAACVGAWGLAAVGAAAGTAAPLPQAHALGLALLAGFGPVAAAYAVTAATRGGDGAAPSDGALATAFQLAVGSLLCSAPVAVASYAALVPAGALVVA